jgi:hypothetical protein
VKTASLVCHVPSLLCVDGRRRERSRGLDTHTGTGGVSIWLMGITNLSELVQYSEGNQLN